MQTKFILPVLIIISNVVLSLNANNFITKTEENYSAVIVNFNKKGLQVTR